MSHQVVLNTSKKIIITHIHCEDFQVQKNSTEMMQQLLENDKKKLIFNRHLDTIGLFRNSTDF